MATIFTLFCTMNDLIVHFNRLRPVAWYEVTSLNDQDNTGKLYGSEFLLFEEPGIDKQKILKQFSDSKEAEINEDGVLYLYYRAEEMPSHKPGYGRKAKIGLDKDGNIAIIMVAWDSPHAGTPSVDRFLALSGLEYQEGEPNI